jgi:hypothetical protein
LFYLNNIYRNIYNIFSDPPLLYAKNIRKAFGTLAYTPEVTPKGLFENYSSFLQGLDET